MARFPVLIMHQDGSAEIGNGFPTLGVARKASGWGYKDAQGRLIYRTLGGRFFAHEGTDMVEITEGAAKAARLS